MSETQPLNLDFTQTDDVLQVLPRPPLRSSENLGWNGIYVQQHLQPAWEMPEYAHTRHMLLVHDATVTVPAQRWFDGRKQEEQLGGGNNNIAIVPATVLHRANWSQESPFTLLFLEPDRLIRVASEFVPIDRLQLIPQHAMRDPFIYQIGRSLAAELGAERLGDRLFADSLTIALSIHLLRHYADFQQPLRADRGGLSPRKLQQAIAYIDAHLADLTITAIAQNLELSPYYFSRSFKQSIGVSPYQYVIERRIDRAKLLLKTTSLSIAAISDRVGFASQNQFTIQFRKLVGTTPLNYRQQL